MEKLRDWMGMLLVCGMLALGCNGDREKTDWMPGTYVDHAGGEFSVADDTLVVRAMGGIHYRIDRRTGFNLLRDGKKGERQYETEQWQAIAEREPGLLREQHYGKLLVFDRDSAALWVGRRKYVKLED